MRTFNSQCATLALVAGLLFAAAPAANAHDPGYYGHRGHVNGTRTVYLHRSTLPQTMLKNRDFIRWYERNVRRLRLERSWQHVYRSYERDRYSLRIKQSHYKAKRHEQRKRANQRKPHRRH